MRKLKQRSPDEAERMGDLLGVDWDQVDLVAVGWALLVIATITRSL